MVGSVKLRKLDVAYLISLITLILIYNNYLVSLPKGPYLRYLLDLSLGLVRDMGYLGLFLTMSLESALVPIPSEVVMPLAGYLAFEGYFELPSVILMASLANLTGSLLAYYLGLKGGRLIVVKYGRLLMISERKLREVEDYFEKRGALAVLLGRLLPGVRTLISLPAGIASMDLKAFSLCTLIGSLPWNTALSLGGYALRENWNIISELLDPYYPLILAIITVSLAYYYLRRKAFTSGS